MSEHLEGVGPAVSGDQPAQLTTISIMSGRTCPLSLKYARLELMDKSRARVDLSKKNGGL
jgi:hypothetical protein